MSISKMSFKAKLLVTGVLLSVTPMVIVSGVIVMQNRKMVDVAASENTKLAKTDLDHIAQGVYSMCQAQQELVQQNVNSSLNVARKILASSGGICLGQEKVQWTAVNQYTSSATSVELPKMMTGDKWLGNTQDAKVQVPVVDEVRQLVGGTCTIFQKMNDSGDMLRIATNVQKKDGARAIGTYIPAVGPDGKPNAVVSSVLRGETYRGRAFVVDKWYVTAYEPLFDSGKNVIGALYVGVPEESVTSLRKAVMETKVGKTGYVYVLDSAGNYVISAGGKRDGENIWEAKDASGSLFIQEIVKRAKALKPGEVAEMTYPWKNAEDKVAREKIARLMYFEPWDWIIGASSYLDEFYDAKFQSEAIGRQSNWMLGAVAGTSLALTVFIWMVIASGMTKRLNRVVAELTDGAEQVSSAAGQVAAASQSLAEGATEQAAGLEETSSSLEEMSSMTRQNADNAQQANVLASGAKKAADSGSHAMSKMTQAINDIQKSSNETAKIIKVIDEIAFQTNLLALNAAVEAARAGEAGKGFAVVAEEVRNLAMRSAEAAKNTSAMIEESVRNAKNGVDIAGEVGKVLSEIVTSIGKTTDLVAEIAAASQEQAKGIDQVNTAVSQMDKVTQQNAANAEESASASEELNAQAESMKSIVNDLVALVSGAKTRSVNEPAKTVNVSDRKTEQHTEHAASNKVHELLKNVHATAKAGRSTSNSASKASAKAALPLDDDQSFDAFNN